MKNIIPVLVLFLLASGCQKLKENIGESLIINAMTDGQWKVTRFYRDTADVTAEFSPYLFQFKKDKTVDAIRNAGVEKTGTWAADATNQTIASNFANAGTPLQFFNGTWKITNNSWTFVEATLTVNGEVRTLRLDK